MTPPPPPIFAPSAETVARSQMTQFARFCEAEAGVRLPDYAALHAFSVQNLRGFWTLFLRWSELISEGNPQPVCEGDSCEAARFFPALRLGYVENLLRDRAPGDADRPALTARDEEGHVVRLTRGELRRRVMVAAAALHEMGVKPGDHVVAVARNTADTVIACLGTVALGAAWSATGPDLGVAALRDRFGQLAPRVLFHHTSYHLHGAVHSIADRIAALRAELPSLAAVIALDSDPFSPAGEPALSFDELPRLPFNHPLFVLFSSGTTGPPKCIVHGAGGTLIEHHKEHRLHGDLGPTDKLLFHTSCGWMMWNWQLSALACGAEIVLYDGSVSYPQEDALWRLVADERVTVFGTSPAYLQYCREAAITPAERVALPALRAILSTGSVLPDSLYPWVRDAVKTVPLQSISGGTDIIGCFVLGNPNLPVYPGELQSVSLGMDVRALGGGDGIGELVCANPFPSRPVGLHGDPEGRRFHEAYFSQNPGVWTHGDRIEITPRGGARIHGRSDGVMNIRGIRIGPAEIYRSLEGIAEIVEAMAVEQAAPDQPGGSRLVLLVVLGRGRDLDRPLTLRVKKEISQRCSMVHVPSVIAQVAELPTTHSGKRSERAARDAVNGRPAANAGALRNPGCLDVIREHPALLMAGAR